MANGKPKQQHVGVHAVAWTELPDLSALLTYGPSVYVGHLYTDDDVQDALNSLSDRQIAILGLTHLKRS